MKTNLSISVPVEMAVEIIKIAKEQKKPLSHLVVELIKKGLK